MINTVFPYLMILGMNIVALLLVRGLTGSADLGFRLGVFVNVFFLLLVISIVAFGAVGLVICWFAVSIFYLVIASKLNKEMDKDEDEELKKVLRND